MFERIGLTHGSLSPVQEKGAVQLIEIGQVIRNICKENIVGLSRNTRNLSKMMMTLVTLFKWKILGNMLQVKLHCLSLVPFSFECLYLFWLRTLSIFFADNVCRLIGIDHVQWYGAKFLLQIRDRYRTSHTAMLKILEGTENLLQEYSSLILVSF